MRLSTRMSTQPMFAIGMAVLTFLTWAAGPSADGSAEGPSPSQRSSGPSRSALAAAAELDCDLQSDEAGTRMPRRTIALPQTDEAEGALGCGADAG